MAEIDWGTSWLARITNDRPRLLQTGPEIRPGGATDHLEIPVRTISVLILRLPVRLVETLIANGA